MSEARTSSSSLPFHPLHLVSFCCCCLSEHLSFFSFLYIGLVSTARGTFTQAMFVSSSIPAAVYAASPRAQLHMIHIQDRLSADPPRKTPQAVPSPPPRGDRDSHLCSLNATMPHPVEWVSEIPPCAADLSRSPPQEDQHAHQATHPYSMRPNMSSEMRSVTPCRRNCSCSVSSGSIRLRSSSPPQPHRPSQGYAFITLFGFTRSCTPVRTASMAPSSTAAKTSLSQAEQPLAEPDAEDAASEDVAPAQLLRKDEAHEQAKGLNISATSPSLKALPASPTFKEMSSTTLPSAQQSNKSQSGAAGPNTHASPFDSYVVVSEMSVPLEGSFHVLLSEASATVEVSDTNEKEEW